MNINIKSFSLLSFFLFSFFISEISGQVAATGNALKKDKDISWIGETEFIYQLEHHDRMNFTPTTSSQEETRLIKIDPAATCNFGNEKFLTNYLLSLAQDGLLKSYSQEGKSMSTDDVFNRLGSSDLDTVTTIDPETMEETFAILRTDPIFNISAFKIKQWWYYNKSTKTFQSAIKAIGPLVDRYDKEGNISRQDFLFWIDMEQSAIQNFDFNQANIVWAKETINTVNFDNTKKIKGNFRKTFKNLTFQNPKKGKSQVLENESWYAYCAKPISASEVNQLLSASKDSIITFHPETFEEKIVVVKNPKVKFKDFKYYRVHQHWYFDKEKNQLASKLITLGPMEEVNNEKGELKYRRALYYIQGE